jgi:Predicted methyltransferase (contains TPR repeat)
LAGDETAAPEAFGGRAWTVGPKRRYAHDPDTVRAALTAAGLGEIACETIVVRHDEGEPVPGRLVLARR